MLMAALQTRWAQMMLFECDPGLSVSHYSVPLLCFTNRQQSLIKDVELHHTGEMNLEELV